ncbi:MAG: YicC/YloC family endoribonuclease [Candidatus Babeliales bacterium]
MTGFASKTVTLALDTHEKAHLTISLKSLNSRFFEATCKLHYQLNSLETEFLKILKNTLHRGHIYLIIHMDNQNLFKGAVEPSIKTIDGYIKAIDTIKQKFGVQGTLSVADLLQLPNVFSIEEIDIDEKSKQLVINTVVELTRNLVTIQEKEGNVLKKDLEQRVAIMHKEIETIEQASNALMATQKEKVHSTFKELEADESKLAEMQKSNAYMLLDKMDIHEEIVRFKSHLKSLSSQLDSSDVEKGKRLDFTLQELGREINTIAAKCSDATIGALAINVKVELEKAREQTQNIV